MSELHRCYIHNHFSPVLQALPHKYNSAVKDNFQGFSGHASLDKLNCPLGIKLPNPVQYFPGIRQMIKQALATGQLFFNLDSFIDTQGRQRPWEENGSRNTKLDEDEPVHSWMRDSFYVTCIRGSIVAMMVHDHGENNSIEQMTESLISESRLIPPFASKPRCDRMGDRMGV